ncbi:hypothetical protein BKD30_07600 [Tersicoccus phoenicis]|uniref:NAD-dependent epimerase/dehydratase domain-containing protein n=1 Tax=Tersicoccus phoenicis TaxID=554083 RepID=A0A1R1LB40_9MICC|nr:hypothetical protein BKD30_07600 [Tersicoccus phoenicis]
MPVLIVGCGDLGTEAGLRFAAAGHRVTGWRRRPEALPAALHGVAADVVAAARLSSESAGGLPALDPGTGVVGPSADSAGGPFGSGPGVLPVVDPGTGVVVVSLTPSSRDAAGYRATYVDGTRAALAAVDRAGARPRVVFVSSTSVLGSDHGAELDESAPAEPTSETASALAEAERLVLARPDGVVLRLAGIYGPGRTRLIDRVRAGDTGRASHWTNRIHRDDAAAAIVRLATLAAPAPIYHGVDDEPARESDVLDFLAGELGVSHTSDDADPSLTGPVGSGRPGDVKPNSRFGAVAPSGDVDTAPPPMADTGKRLSNAQLRSTGWSPAYPSYREGYRALLAGVGRRHP